jgi:putative transposase
MDELADRTRTDPIGMNTWRAGCAETCTSGSEGGPQKPTRRKAGRALRPDPYTYVATWAGTVYVALVVDAYSRRILGWRAATSMSTPLVLDALEQAIWTRQRAGVTDLSGLIHHNDAGSQYTSIAFTARLIEAGVDASVGSVGDAFDNALAETTIGLYKTELIRRQGPWRTCDQVELATLEYVDWYNHRRPHEAAADLPPAEFETLYDPHQTRLDEAASQIR